MGNNKHSDKRSRRWFLTFFLQENDNAGKSEKVKMLTADGKLVEVDKNLLDKATNRFKASNKDIFGWMKNPSKDNI